MCEMPGDIQRCAERIRLRSPEDAHGGSGAPGHCCGTLRASGLSTPRAYEPQRTRFCARATALPTVLSASPPLGVLHEIWTLNRVHNSPALRTVSASHGTIKGYIIMEGWTRQRHGRKACRERGWTDLALRCFVAGHFHPKLAEVGKGVIEQRCFHGDQKRGWTPCAPMSVPVSLPSYSIVFYRLS